MSRLGVLLLLGITLIVSGVLLTACSNSSNPAGSYNYGGGGGNGGGGGGGGGNPYAVTIYNYAFTPSSLTVPAGTTVTWTNKDNIGHTVTSDTGVFGSGTLNMNGTYSYKFMTAGSFPYHCSMHTYMKGTITVTGSYTGGGGGY